MQPAMCDNRRMTMDTAHPSYWQISEVVFGVPLLAAIALHWIAPLGVPPGPLRLALILVGAALLILGGWVALSARREFARHSQSMEPKRSISRIVDTGVFAISRNPLYLGIAVGLAGAALAFSNLWILVLLLPAVVACHYVLIAPEERYLRAKFGNEYTEYAARVRRWLGRG
jgi:protein-S-isoprenylcysteine O-methyltransferase Ste14